MQDASDFRILDWTLFYILYRSVRYNRRMEEILDLPLRVRERRSYYSAARMLYSADKSKRQQIMFSSETENDTANRQDSAAYYEVSFITEVLQ